MFHASGLQKLHNSQQFIMVGIPLACNMYLQTQILLAEYQYYKATNKVR